MAIKYSINETTGQVHIESDGPVVFTGPVTGVVDLPDGTTVDVSRDVIEADSDEQAADIAEAVRQRYIDEGHPEVDGQFADDTPPTDQPQED